VLGDQLGRLPAADDLAVGHHGHLVGEPLGLLDVVRRHQDRGAARAERVDQRPELGADLRVEPNGRLVEQQQRRVVHEPAREQQAAAHAAGELVDRVAPAPVEACQVKPAVHRGPHVLDPVEPREHGEVVLHRHVHVEVVELGDHTHLRPRLLRLAGQLVAQDGDPALVGPCLAGKQPHRRRLARAIRAEQAEADALWHLEVEAVHRGDRPEPLHDSMQLDRGQTTLQPTDSTRGERTLRIFRHAYKPKLIARG
jgi:hypothetical protein